MRVAAVAFAFLALTGCARPAENEVRHAAATAFGCMDYLLTVDEIGPEVYRAQGCEQELVYVCAAAPPGAGADEPAIACERKY